VPLINNPATLDAIAKQEYGQHQHENIESDPGEVERDVPSRVD